MNAVRPVRCLFCRFTTSVERTAIFARHAHSKRKPAHPNVKAEDMGLVDKQSTFGLRQYSEDDKKELAKRYTKEQLAAIEAGESSIDPNDLATQGVVKRDPFSLRYLEDFSKVQPVVDKPIREPATNYDPNLRMKTEEEQDEDLVKFVQNFKEDVSPEEARLQWMKFIDNARVTVGDEKAELKSLSYQAPELPKMPDPRIRYPKSNEEEEDPLMKRLLRQKGITHDQLRRLRIKNLVSHRVVNQTRLGKVQSQYFLTIAGDGNGSLGIGEGKSAEPEDARKQAMRAAVRNMQPISRYEERTIYGEVAGKVGAVELQLMARPPGFGVRCQHLIFEMCRAAGISDLAARVTRSRNKMNVVKATFEALQSQRLPEDIARARGKKLVDVRKVYYGGLV